MCLPTGSEGSATPTGTRGPVSYLSPHRCLSRAGQQLSGRGRGSETRLELECHRAMAALLRETQEGPQVEISLEIESQPSDLYAPRRGIVGDAHRQTRAQPLENRLHGKGGRMRAQQHCPCGAREPAQAVIRLLLRGRVGIHPWAAHAQQIESHRDFGGVTSHAIA